MRIVIFIIAIMTVFLSSKKSFLNVRNTVQISTNDSAPGSDHGYQVITSGNYTPQVYTYNNVSYVIWKQRKFSPYNLKVKIFSIDHNNNDSLSESYLVVEPFENASNIHLQSSMIVNDSGYIFVAATIPGVENQWAGDIAIYKSNDPECVSCGFTQMHITNDVDHYQYPHFYKNNNGLYVTYIIGSRMYIEISDKWGNAWDQQVCLINNYPDVYINYSVAPVQDNNDYINICVNMSNDGPEAYPSCFLLKSTNGFYWESYTSSIRKNTLLSSLNYSELAADFAVIDEMQTNDTLINYIQTGYINNDNPTLLIIKGGCSEGQVNSYVNHYEIATLDINNNWKFQEIKGVYDSLPYYDGWIDIYVPERPYAVYVYDNSNIELITTKSNIGGVNPLLRYRSLTNGSSWKFIDTVYSDTTSFYVHVSNNAVNLDTFALIGAIPDGLNNSNILISTLYK